MRFCDDSTNVSVTDPYLAINDAAMPSLALALNPLAVRRKFSWRFRQLAGEGGAIRLSAIRVIRYKPGRRCVIEYDVELQRLGGATESATFIGKVMAHRFGNSGYQTLKAFWDSGFSAESEDGLSVPEPMGTIGKFRIWLQRKIPGQMVTELLAGPEGETLAQRIAELAHKVHLSNVPTGRSHTIADELRILRECLARVSQSHPRWAQRLKGVLRACERLGSALPAPVLTGIHRDYYPDQILLAGSRLYLIDFDLYCAGDPALDIGNCLGHITEQAVRTLDNPEGLARVEQAMEERFAELAGDAARRAVESYATLTLARHIYLSTLFPERRPFSEKLLELCERRLAVAEEHTHELAYIL